MPREAPAFTRHRFQDVLPRILKSATHYRQATDEIRRLAANRPRPGSDAAIRLELWSRLARDYEDVRLSKSCPDPLAAIRFRMQERGLKQKDLAPLLGGKNRASEILAGKRALTVAMIRALCKALDIPAEVLIRESREPAAGKRATPK
jgi:HTH-type transcriptional regulator/antitoxin HigA